MTEPEMVERHRVRDTPEFIAPAYSTPEVEAVAEAIFWARTVAEERLILGGWELVREEIKGQHRHMALAAISAGRCGNDRGAAKLSATVFACASLAKAIETMENPRRSRRWQAEREVLISYAKAIRVLADAALTPPEKA